MSITLLKNYSDHPWDSAKSGLIEDLTRLQSSLNELFNANFIETLGDDWTDAPWVTTNFTCNSTGAITPNRVVPYSICYKAVAKILHINATFVVTVNNASTTEIRFSIPGGFSPRVLPSLSKVDDNRHRTAALWNNSGTSGAAAAFVNVSGKYVGIQRWDGTAAFPNGTQCTLGCMLQIPIIRS